MRWVKTLRALAAALLVVGVGGVRLAQASDPPVDPGPTPRAQCGPGSKPETGAQGRAPAADFASGRAAQGSPCNTQVLRHVGRFGGFRVHRYVDGGGHECAFYDSTLLFPTNTLAAPTKSPGVFVLDMADPTHPVQTATLSTPAMVSPHESLNLNVKRGLLVADMGNPITAPGWVDIYDLSQDCRHPVLKSSTPLGILGHEGTFSPDGNTFWVSSTGGHTLTALDVSNPSLPVPLFTDTRWVGHALNVSDDANRAYPAYAAHYCSVPTRDEPGVVACSFILSGLRVFDIRDPYHPKEIAYSNFPTKATQPEQQPSSYVMCAAAFAPERGEIWFSDGNSGFYAVKVTNGVWPFPRPTTALGQIVNKVTETVGGVVPPPQLPATSDETPPPQMAATGGTVPVGTALVLLALALGLRRARRRLS